MHVSFTGLGVQVPGSPPIPTVGVPVHADAVHAPVVVSQTWPVVHCESSVQGPQTFGVVAPQMGDAAFVHWAFVQQLPGTQAVLLPAAQQMSAVLAHVELAVHPVPETHRPAAPQMVVGPYVGSLWHSASEVQLPHVLGVVAPHIWPGVVQLASVWQLPGTQLPAVSQMYAPA